MARSSDNRPRLPKAQERTNDRHRWMSVGAGTGTGTCRASCTALTTSRARSPISYFGGNRLMDHRGSLLWRDDGFRVKRDIAGPWRCASHIAPGRRLGARRRRRRQRRDSATTPGDRGERRGRRPYREPDRCRGECSHHVRRRLPRSGSGAEVAVRSSQGASDPFR